MMKSMFRLELAYINYVFKEGQSPIQLVQPGYSCRMVTSANTLSFLATVARFKLVSMVFCIRGKWGSCN